MTDLQSLQVKEQSGSSRLTSDREPAAMLTRFAVTSMTDQGNCVSAHHSKTVLIDTLR